MVARFFVGFELLQLLEGAFTINLLGSIVLEPLSPLKYKPSTLLDRHSTF